ncbi:ParB/RepB/Spo0J family partition protein [Eubacterium ramulus]
MAAKKGGLGKGLDSLLVNKVNADHSSDSATVKEKSTTTKKKSTKKETPDTMVKLSLVEPNREQPRKHFDEDGLLELAESIKQYGILQPLLVQEKSGYYEIIAGERRWRAAKLAGLKEIPVIVRNLTEQQIVEISLIENIQREDLNPIEEAQAFRRLMEEFHMKQDEIADRVSKSRTAVTNSMRLLKLSKQVQQMVIDEMISTGHARCLISIEDPELQHQLALRIFDEKLSVRETEKLVRKLLQENKAPQKKINDPVLSAIYADLADQMKQIFGTKVEIHQRNDQKGKIEIEYYSQDELNRLIELIQSIQKQ